MRKKLCKKKKGLSENQAEERDDEKRKRSMEVKSDTVWNILKVKVQLFEGMF